MWWSPERIAEYAARRAAAIAEEDAAFMRLPKRIRDAMNAADHDLNPIAVLYCYLERGEAYAMSTIPSDRLPRGHEPYQPSPAERAEQRRIARAAQRFMRRARAR